jgi:hypothetical protein
MSWRVAFLISAALNVLIIGAVAGFVLGGGLTRVRNMGTMAPRSRARVARFA